MVLVRSGLLAGLQIKRWLLAAILVEFGLGLGFCKMNMVRVANAFGLVHELGLGLTRGRVRAKG